MRMGQVSIAQTFADGVFFPNSIARAKMALYCLQKLKCEWGGGGGKFRMIVPHWRCLLLLDAMKLTWQEYVSLSFAGTYKDYGHACGQESDG